MKAIKGQPGALYNAMKGKKRKAAIPATGKPFSPTMGNRKTRSMGRGSKRVATIKGKKRKHSPKAISGLQKFFQEERSEQKRKGTKRKHSPKAITGLQKFVQEERSEQKKKGFKRKGMKDMDKKKVARRQTMKR